MNGYAPSVQYRSVGAERVSRASYVSFPGKPKALLCTNSKGNPEPDTDLRDHENAPPGESVYDYFEREVLPHVPGAWIDEFKTDPHDGEVGIVGYEIPFNSHFHKFEPPRPLEEIDADLRECTDRIKEMIEEISA